MQPNTIADLHKTVTCAPEDAIRLRYAPLLLKRSEKMMLFEPIDYQEWEQWLTPVRKHLLDELCQWIDDHLEETIGWQQLLAQSGLQYQTIQSLFYKYHSLTPMTWIRRRREITQGAEGRRQLD